MAGSAIINSIYNQYVTTYAPKKSIVPYTPSKRSELRGVYNTLSRINKEAPLYIVDTSEESKEFAVSIKDSSRQLKETLISITEGRGAEGALSVKTPYSSNEDLVSVGYIGNSGYDKEQNISHHDIEILGMASPQINLGNYLKSDTRDIDAGFYSFDMSVNGLVYEFQYNIYDDDNNIDIQNRLNRLINNANVGISSQIIMDNKGNSALEITTDRVGNEKPNEPLFEIEDNNITGYLYGSVDYLGINHISELASNAHYVIDGTPKSSSANSFTIDDRFEVVINSSDTTNGNKATVGFKPDSESLYDNLNILINGYNSFINSIEAYKDTHLNYNKLVNEFTNITSNYKPYLQDIGINVDDKELSIDKNIFMSASTTLEPNSYIMPVKNYAINLLRKSANVTIDPMNYANRIMVAYKNPSKCFQTPYISGPYSGMMYNTTA